MAGNEEALAALEAARRAIVDLTDEHTRAITEAWLRAWDEVSAELEAAFLRLAEQGGQITAGRVNQAQYALAAMDALGAALEQAVVSSGTVVTASLFAAVARAAEAELEIIRAQFPDTSPFVPVRAPAQALGGIVARTTEQITSRLLPIAEETYEVIRRELIRGIAVGENPIPVARRMVERAEDHYNFGLSRALVIARTEMLDAHRAAGQAVDRANSDSVKEWEWYTNLDTKTCIACIAMHGRRFPISQPGPEGHPNCRCTRLPVSRPWAELGLPGVSGPDFPQADPEAWFSSLPETDQRSILGPARYSAWAAGRYPIRDWAVRRENPEWRPSWMPGPVPSSRSVRSVA